MRISDWSSDVCSSDLNVQSFNSSFTLDAPVEDSDVDLTGVKITANAKDITSGVTGSDSATTTIVVDAVLDDAGQATQAAAPSVEASANAQEIDLDLSLGFVSRSEERRVGKECVST